MTDTPGYAIATATEADAPDVAEVWLRSYDAALPAVRRAHSDDEVRGWFRYVVVPEGRTYLARDAQGAAAGMMVLGDGVLEQLYLDPAHRGRGLGDRFVALAKELCPAGLELWTFQVNAPAHRFYERHGFTEAGRTDGSENEEREPDVRYAWLP
ncbi:GNAT family N-acetyltransferase [Streptomyces sp. NPDC101118]|uniref:GNAT family N-acetyltransferase n=1 Tax=Streptomyces sp. NPDC101118 TaxID=3366109 RepID=UPI00380F12FD